MEITERYCDRCREPRADEVVVYLGKDDTPFQPHLCHICLAEFERILDAFLLAGTDVF